MQGEQAIDGPNGHGPRFRERSCLERRGSEGYRLAQLRSLGGASGLRILAPEWWLLLLP